MGCRPSRSEQAQDKAEHLDAEVDYALKQGQVEVSEHGNALCESPGNLTAKGPFPVVVVPKHGSAAHEKRSSMMRVIIASLRGAASINNLRALMSWRQNRVVGVFHTSHIQKERGMRVMRRTMHSLRADSRLVAVLNFHRNSFLAALSSHKAAVAEKDWQLNLLCQAQEEQQAALKVQDTHSEVSTLTAQLDELRAELEKNKRENKKNLAAHDKAFEEAISTRELMFSGVLPYVWEYSCDPPMNSKFLEFDSATSAKLEAIRARGVDKERLEIDGEEYLIWLEGMQRMNIDTGANAKLRRRDARVSYATSRMLSSKKSEPSTAKSGKATPRRSSRQEGAIRI
eukprot:TRINITY_DN9556_c0_g1_i2.p1 TRINITY_DN9556_c0_g1~~TRINITY_DN9556_c0_g1_i2.p1  ORF type:complete len:342 (-),score=71.60 TRINITY_DN9556_c0_g1_i2:394-1419(-)